MQLHGVDVGRVDAAVRAYIPTEVGRCDCLPRLALRQSDIGVIHSAVSIEVPDQESHRDVEVRRRSIRPGAIHTIDPNQDHLLIQNAR